MGPEPACGVLFSAGLTARSPPPAKRRDGASRGPLSRHAGRRTCRWNVEYPTRHRRL